jgi:hypothetical protein
MSPQMTDTSGQFTDILDELYHSFHINEKNLDQEIVKQPKELEAPDLDKKVMYVGAFNARKKQPSAQAS